MGKTSNQCYKEWENSWYTGNAHALTYSQYCRVLKRRKFQDIHGVHGTYGWLVKNWEKTATDFERKLYTRIYRRR